MEDQTYVVPLCVILAEQIQLIYNVSIKIFCVADNCAFLGSLGSSKIRTLDTGARLQRAPFCWDTPITMAQWYANKLLVMHTEFASKACALERLYNVQDNLVNKLLYVTQNKNL